MEINIEQELQMLKSEYAMFKKELEKQSILNEKLLKSTRRRSVLAVSKEIRERIWLDFLTIPTVMIICLNTNFPLLFGILVSLWALADLGATLWFNHRINTNDLLNDDVRTVTGKITSYRKFYTRTLTASIIPLTAMLTYIFIHLYAHTDNPETERLITTAGIVYITLSILITILRYKKHTRKCRELLEQFEH